MGNGTNGQWTFLDIITLISFVVSLQNLEMNITQNDMQDQTQALNKTADERVDKLLNELHAHLEEQDKKLNIILKRLEILE